MAIIGAGRVGTTLGVLLGRAGHSVVAATGREPTRQRVGRYLPEARFFPATDSAKASQLAEVVVVGVPDDSIHAVCEELVRQGGLRPGQFVIHLSGALGLGALEPARLAGAEVLSMHPLQTFPDVETGIDHLPGSAMALTAASGEGSALGASLSRDVGCVAFALQDEMKPLYHAAAVFCSNYLVVVEGMAERLFQLAGVEDPVSKFAPLARASLDAALGRGPALSLTGPAARGDVGTVALNLRALTDRAPDAVPAYVTLARAAGELALQAGHLSDDHRVRLEGELARWE